MSQLNESVRRVSRREALALFGAAGAAAVAGCSSDSPTAPSATTSTTTPTTAAGGACLVSPTETVGPYPSITDLFRSDIREGRSGTAVMLELTVVDVNSSCAAVDHAQVEIWQCDAEGHYSQYSQQGYDARSETFLRGIQTTDASGRVTFLTVYPGWYAGRATHIHVEVTVGGRSVKVTQIAFPESTTASVYATGVYAGRGPNPTANARDMVFADSIDSELAAVSGDPVSGLTATYTVGVAI
jgi:protocatechuate 3,4-dioxygenase beta subunit